MAALLIPEINPDILGRLEDRAKKHGRSLESEARAILESAVGSTKASQAETRQAFRELRKRLAGKIQGDSADLIREDRER